MIQFCCALRTMLSDPGALLKVSERAKTAPGVSKVLQQVSDVTLTSKASAAAYYIQTL